MSASELIYDWNKIEAQLQKPDRHIGFDDETLRDGLQSPSVSEPPVEKKIELLHLMDELGIDTADIGLPGAGGKILDSTEGFQQEVRTWTISKSGDGATFYSRHGDLFAYGCALISLGFVSASFMRRRLSEARP